MAGAARLRRLEAEPQATFVVITLPDEPEGWVPVEADVTVHDGGARGCAGRGTAVATG